MSELKIDNPAQRLLDILDSAFLLPGLYSPLLPRYKNSLADSVLAS